jgi:DNA-binding response OmpR family regulator
MSLKDDGRRYQPQNKETGSSDRTFRILVADDDVEMVALIDRALRKAGYDVVSCHNGWDILKILGFFPPSRARKHIDLVISDIRLPGITGIEALRVGSYAGSFPPLILITAFGDAWTHAEAKRLGAADLLDKPFDIDVLVERVRDHVSRLR